MEKHATRYKEASGKVSRKLSISLIGSEENQEGRRQSTMVPGHRTGVSLTDGGS